MVQLIENLCYEIICEKNKIFLINKFHLKLIMAQGKYIYLKIMIETTLHTHVKITKFTLFNTHKDYNSINLIVFNVQEL